MDRGLVSLIPCAHRCLHRDLHSRAKEKTIRRYTQVYESFSCFIVEFGQFDSRPVAAELDRLFMEYRDAEQISKTTHARLLTAIEFFLPELKGQLRRAKESLKGRQLGSPINHTIPSTSRIVFLFAARAGADGNPRMGAGLIIQAQLGFRCDELVHMKRSDVDVPRSSLEPILIAVGTTKPTKVKRKQFVRVTFDDHFEAFMLLRYLVHGIEDPEEPIFGFTYWQFHGLIRKYDVDFGLNIGLTAHSGRACFATEAVIIHNKATPQIMREGRWLSENSFRTYLDAIGANAAQAKFASRGLGEAGDFCRFNIFRYLTLQAIVHGNGKEETQRLSGSSPQAEGRHARSTAGATATARVGQHRGQRVVQSTGSLSQLANAPAGRHDDGQGSKDFSRGKCEEGNSGQQQPISSSKGSGKRKGGRAILKR